MRLAVALAVAAPLVILDLAVKAVRPTPWWAWHERSPAWLVLCVAVLAALVLVLRVPSVLVPPAAGVLAAGILGNALSAASNGLEVANPLVLTGERAVLAFNLADVWVLVGLASLFAVLAVWLVRNREQLQWTRRRPSPRG